MRYEMKKTFKIIILIFLCMSIAIAAGTFMFYINLNIPVKSNEIQSNISEKNKNILFVGDADGLSDTIFVASYNIQKKEINLLSIPRDVYYPRPGYYSPEEMKINAAYSEGKIDTLKSAVEDILKINIDNYVILNYDGFKRIVDVIGGVEVNVPFDMVYDDDVAKPPLHINLKKGLQILDGEKALEFVRYRHGYSNGDIGRINAQHDFFKSFINKVTSPSILPKIPSLTITLSRNIKTDLSISDLTAYTVNFVKNKPDKINMTTIPGEGRYQNDVSYYFIDADQTIDLANQFFNNSADKPSTYKNIDNLNINVEVLNGAGVPGLATKYADKLKKQGFTVVKIGNVDGINYSASIVYIISSEEKAKKVAKALSINFIERNVEKNPNIDVIVIIGEDKK
jgi:LCP family protein required for cell wall assembly